MHVSFLGGAHDLFNGYVSGVVPVSDVLADGAVEQHRLLRDDAEVAPQRRQPHVRHYAVVVEILSTVLVITLVPL